MREENLYASGSEDGVASLGQFAKYVLDDLPVAVYLCNAEGYISAYNKAASSLWARQPELNKEQWSGAWKMFYPNGDEMLPENSPMARSAWLKVSVDEEIIFDRPDGSKSTIRSISSPKFGKQAELIGVVTTLIDVTNYAQTAERQSVLSAIVNTSDDAIINKTLQGVITSWNKAAEKLFGYTDFEAIGKNATMLIPPERLEEEAILTENIQKGKCVNHFETVRLTKDGRRVPVTISASAIEDSNGNIIGVSKIARDITDVKKADEKQAILAAIVSTSDDAIISKTLQGFITSWNKAAEKLFGYTEEEALGKHITMLIPSERLKEEDEIISNISVGNPIDHFETIRVAKDGRRVPVSLSVSPIKDSTGKIIGASKIARDITEIKKADERRAVLAAIVDTSDDAIISKTLQGIITSWNKAAEKTFGYTEEEVLGKHISLLIPEERQHEEDVIISNVAKGNKIDHFETIRKAKDGTKIPISLSVSPIKNSAGKIIGASKIARDISELKSALADSERNAGNLRTLNTFGKEISQNLNIEQILQKVTDLTTRLTGAEFGAFFYNTYNQEGESYTLYTLSGASRETSENFGMPVNTARFQPTFAGGEPVRVDDITKDPRFDKNAPQFGIPAGNLPVKSYFAVPVKTNAGDVIGGLFFGHPEPGKFTHEHEELILSIASQASISLVNAQLYKEVLSLNAKKDEFIGMASHELKTPLTSISGYMQILERLNSNAKSRTFINKTAQQVKKLSALVNDLLDVSKIEAGKLQLVKREFDLIKVIEDAVELIRNSQVSHSIKVAFDTESLIMNGDPNRIEQLIINLLTNAIKYSPAANQVDLILQSQLDKIIVGVRDTGMGIEPDKVNHIFSRFYRVEGMNPSISGLGIGLYICKEIIDRHGGKIWVDSTYGEGSTFWFSLPVH